MRGLALIVIARSEATKQSSLSARAALDCFALLAMTVAKKNAPARAGAFRIGLK
jgi:hypothetical protein